MKKKAMRWSSRRSTLRTFRGLIGSILLSLSLVSLSQGKCILDLPLNDGGDKIVERSEYNNKAAMHGYPAYFKWLPAQSGYALEFAGNGKYGEEGVIYVSPTNLIAKNLTVAFWVNPYPTANIDYESILKGPNGTGYNNGYRIYMRNIAGVKNVGLQVNFGDAEPRDFSFGQIPVNRFTHLAFTYNHQEVVLYKDGEKVASFPETRDINYSSQLAGMCIGNTNYLNFTGILSGVKMFDESLVVAAVKELVTKEPAPVIKTGPESSAKPKDTSYYPTDKLYGPKYDLCRNLIQNPSFEAGVRYWRVWARGETFKKKFELDSGNAFSGTKRLHLYGYKGERASVAFDNFPIPVNAGQKYTLSFYSRGDGSKKNLIVRVQTGIWLVFPINATVALTPEWKRYSFTFTAPNNTVNICFWLSDYPQQDCQGWVDAVQLELGDQVSDYVEKPITAELVTDRADNFFQPGEKINSRLEIHTRPNEKGTATVSVKDFFGKEILNRKYPFAADSRGFISLPMGLPENLPAGLYLARADFELADGYRDYDFFRLGIMRHLDNTQKHKDIFAVKQPNMLPDVEGAFQRLKHIGVGSYVPFSFVPDSRVTEIAGRNNILTVTSVFRGGDTTYDEGDGGKGQRIKPFPENLDLKKVAENVYRTVKAHPEITFWKTVNEPDHDIFLKNKPEKLKAFMEMLRVTAGSIRSANPKAKILSPDPTNMYPGNGISEIEAMINAGLLSVCDIIAIHPYRPRPENPDFDADTDAFLKMLDKHGYHGEVWFTEGIYYTSYNIPEFGLDTTLFQDFWRSMPLSYDFGLGERMAAAYNARMWLVALKYGKRIKMLADWSEFSYILDGYGIPSAYCWAPNTLGQILGNADYVQDVDVSDNIRSYLFEDERKRPVAVFWNTNEEVDREKAAPDSIALGFKPGEVEYLDFMNRTFDPQPGEYIPVGACPIFVRSKPGALDRFRQVLADILGRGKPGTLDRFKQVLDDIQIKGGGLTAVKPTVKILNENKAVVNLFNRTAKTVNAKVAVELAGKTLVSRDMLLKSKETLSLPVDLPAGSSGAIQEIPLKVSLLAAGKSKPQVLDAALRLLICQKRETPVSVDGDFSDWPEKYKITMPDTFKEFLPPNWNKYPKPIPWKGKQDLSADLYAGWDENYLYLALIVRDDIFCPPPEGTAPDSFYKYDSLQLYFDTFGDARDHLPLTGNDNNDYNYDMAYFRNGLPVEAAVVPEWQLVFFNNGPAPEVKSAFKRTADGMVYELAFPANRVRPIVLKPDTSFGFALLINDNDDDYRKRGLTLTPAGTEPWMRPDLYPTMLLK